MGMKFWHKELILPDEGSSFPRVIANPPTAGISERFEHACSQLRDDELICDRFLSEEQKSGYGDNAFYILIPSLEVAMAAFAPLDEKTSESFGVLHRRLQAFE